MLTASLNYIISNQKILLVQTDARTSSNSLILSGEMRPEEVRSKRTDFVVLHPLFLRRVALAAAALTAALIMLWTRRRRG